MTEKPPEPHDESETVPIRVFTTRDAAELAAANLRAHGIESSIEADDCGGFYPNLTMANGARLRVRASDSDAAIALLKTQVSDSELARMENEYAAASTTDSVPRKNWGLGQLLAGLVIGAAVCWIYLSRDKVGSKTIYSFDSNGNANAAHVFHEGQLTETVWDRNLDRKWDEWIYYSGGQIGHVKEDNNFDGKSDATWTYSDGLPVTLESDSDFNGLSDIKSVFQNGIVQRVEIKPNGSTFTTTREIYLNGVVSEIWRGGDSNGNFKEVIRYDPFFNPTSTSAPPIQLLPDLK